MQIGLHRVQVLKTETKHFVWNIINTKTSLCTDSGVEEFEPNQSEPLEIFLRKSKGQHKTYFSAGWLHLVYMQHYFSNLFL